MIKIENLTVYGFEEAIRGMRNPKNSWDKSDSRFDLMIDDDKPEWFVGIKDIELMRNLSKAGTDHSKYLRFITVTADITAPLYWWKEFDTYKVGTVANSCSTMHKIHAKEFTLDDFSHEHLFTYKDNSNQGRNLVYYCDEYANTATDVLEFTIEALNHFRTLYLETKDKKFWWQMIQLLPSSYNQKRTVLLNYQVLKNMYHARKSHKLDCWIDFCRWCESLPYFREICVEV